MPLMPFLLQPHVRNAYVPYYQMKLRHFSHLRRSSHRAGIIPAEGKEEQGMIRKLLLLETPIRVSR